MIRFVTVAAATLAASIAVAQPLTTAFTFQGELTNGTSPANGTYDIRFTLYDAATGGAQLGTLCSDNVAVTDGKFTVQLDFGAQFSGQQRFLEVQARPDTGLNCSNSTGFTVLAPRQSLTATPNASYAANAAQLGGQSASFYTNAANLTGTLSDTTLSTNIPRLNLTNSFSGSLGVGLTGIPSARLQVDGADSTASGAGAALRIDNTAAGGSSWFLRAGATGNNTPAGGFSIGDSNAYRLVIDSAGRVGIGTNTPTSILDINGVTPTIRLRNNGDPGYLNLWDVSDGYFFGFANTSASAWGAVPANSTRTFFVVQSSGRVGSTLDSGASGVAYRNLLDDGSGNAFIDILNANTGTIANTLRLGGGTEGIGSKRNAGGNQNGLDFYTAATTRVSITNSGAVGIGTTAPSSNLEVAGASPAMHIRNTADQGGGILEATDAGVFLGIYNPGSTSWGTVPAAGSKLLFGAFNTGAVGTVFELPAGSGNYVFNNTLDDGSGGGVISGNLTIGASATAQSFLATNAVGIDTGGLATSTGLFQNQPHVLRFGSAPSGEGITSKRTTTGNQFGLDFYTNNTNRVSITNGGNVGIGTSSPISKLNVQDGGFEVTSSAGGQVIANISNNHNGQISLANAATRFIVVMGESSLDATKGGQMVICDQTGTGRAGCQMQASGNSIVFADIKNFVANNPDDPKTQLYYACVEGPEAAMYCRGTGHLEVGHAHIDLPRHFAVMAAEKGLTVQITPLSADCMGIAVTRKSTDSFEVTELFKGQNTCDFDWEVKAVRKGYEDYQVVRPAGLLNPKPIVSENPAPKTE